MEPRWEARNVGQAYGVGHAVDSSMGPRLGKRERVPGYGKCRRVLASVGPRWGVRNGPFDLGRVTTATGFNGAAPAEVRNGELPGGGFAVQLRFNGAALGGAERAV